MHSFILAGDSRVGKTALLQRLAGEEFSSTCSTVGVDFRTCSVGEHAKMTGWDISGCDRFFEVTKQYFARSKVVVLVYSVDNQQSFDNLAKWLEVARTHGNESSTLVLVGNKKDEGDRAISVEQGAEFAKSNSMLFFETSALTAFGCARLLLQLGSLLAE